MIGLEIGLQALEDFDGIRNGRLVDVDLLEPPNECPVLLEELAIFLVSRRPDASDRARGKRRFEQIRGIERAARRGARTDNGVDLVDEQHRIGQLFELFHHGLEPFLEITAIARAGKQRAHVERIDNRFLEDFRHIAFGDLARQPFGDRRLADASIADIDRVVLGPSAQHLDGAPELRIAADERVDLAVARLVIEIDAVILKGGGALLATLALAGFAAASLIAGQGTLLAPAGLRDAVRNEIDRVEPRHVLLLEEIGGVALALGENGDEHIGAGYFLAARRLDVNDGALNDALERRRRAGILRVGHDQTIEFFVDELLQIGLERVDIDIAAGQNGHSVAIFGQREEEMLERREFVTAFTSQVHRRMQSFF